MIGTSVMKRLREVLIRGQHFFMCVGNDEVLIRGHQLFETCCLVEEI